MTYTIRQDNAAQHRPEPVWDEKNNAVQQWRALHITGLIWMNHTELHWTKLDRTDPFEEIQQSKLPTLQNSPKRLAKLSNIPLSSLTYFIYHFIVAMWSRRGQWWSFSEILEMDSETTLARGGWNILPEEFESMLTEEIALDLDETNVNERPRPPTSTQKKKEQKNIRN